MTNKVYKSDVRAMYHQSLDQVSIVGGRDKSLESNAFIFEDFSDS